MKHLKWLGLVAFWVVVSGCSHPADVIQVGDGSTHEERRVLVTFVDRTIGRQLPGNALDGYHATSRYDNSGWSTRLAQSLASRHHLNVVAQWPVTELGVSCVVYEVPAEMSVNQAIATLKTDTDVGSVQPMHSFRVLGDAYKADKLYSDPYIDLQKGFQDLGIAELHRFTIGKGIKIALIDTGVDTEHPDLKDQIKHIENVAPEAADHNLADIHGTAVAGVLAAKPNNGIGIVGIAPGAELLAFRACWPDSPGSLAARCNSFTLALALNKAIQMKSHIINLSLTGPEDELLKRLIEKAVASGIIVIAAVPGADQDGGFPANIPNVIAVSQEKSSLQSAVVVAPGVDILTTVPNNAYDFMTGSSFATPHISGLIALTLQLHPTWKVADIVKLLKDEANPVAYLQAGQNSAKNSSSKF